MLRPTGAVPILRSDNGLIFQSQRFRAACRFYRLPQEFITPYTPEQNGVIERWFRSIKERVRLAAPVSKFCRSACGYHLPVWVGHSATPFWASFHALGSAMRVTSIREPRYSRSPSAGPHGASATVPYGLTMMSCSRAANFHIRRTSSCLIARYPGSSTRFTSSCGSRRRS